MKLRTIALVAFVAVMSSSAVVLTQQEISRFQKVAVLSSAPDALTINGQNVSAGGAVAGGTCTAGLVATSVTAGSGAPGCTRTLTTVGSGGITSLFTVGAQTSNPLLFQVLHNENNTNEDEVRVAGSICQSGSGTSNNLCISSPATNQGGFLSTSVNNEVSFVLTSVTLTSGWGTSPTIQAHSNGSLGRVTLGSSPNATTLVLDTDFGGSAAGPVCMIQDETTGLMLKHSQSTGTITITGSFSANDNIIWQCNEARGQ